MENGVIRLKDPYLWGAGWVDRYEEIRRRVEPILRHVGDHKIPSGFIETVVVKGKRHSRIGRVSFLHMVESFRHYVELVLNDNGSSDVQGVLQDWRERDVSFVSNSGLRSILKQNLLELSTLDPEHSPKAVAVMCGAIAEGLLINALCDVNQATRCVARPNPLTTAAAKVHHVSTTTDLTSKKWSLPALIEVASELKVISKNAAPLLAPVIKDFRNLIHPAAQLRDQYEVRRPEAEGALALLRRLFDDLTP